MNPIEVLEAELAKLKKDREKADKEHEYARNIFWSAGEKLERLETSVRAIERAIEVLKNQ